MKYLSSRQINFVQQDLTRRGITSNALKDELTDHICCAIETNGFTEQTFEAVYHSTVQAFGQQGLLHIQHNHKRIQFKKTMHMTIKSLTATVTATLLLLLVAAPLTGEPPSIKPFRNAKPLKMTSAFGMRLSPFTKTRKMHKGVDFAMPVGTSIVATSAGKVVFVGNSPEGYGKYLKVQHDDAYITLYATLSEIVVAEGDEVQQGQVIAYSGNTGLSTAPHLHYEVIKDGHRVDPADYF